MAHIVWFSSWACTPTQIKALLLSLSLSNWQPNIKAKKNKINDGYFQINFHKLHPDRKLKRNEYEDTSLSALQICEMWSKERTRKSEENFFSSFLVACVYICRTCHYLFLLYDFFLFIFLFQSSFSSNMTIIIFCRIFFHVLLLFNFLNTKKCQWKLILFCRGSCNENNLSTDKCFTRCLFFPLFVYLRLWHNGKLLIEFLLI